MSQSINFLLEIIQINVKKCIHMSMKKRQFDLNLKPDITESLSPASLHSKTKKKQEKRKWILIQMFLTIKFPFVFVYANLN